MPNPLEYIQYGIGVALGSIPRRQTPKEQAISSVMRLARLVEGPFGMHRMAADECQRVIEDKNGREISVLLRKGQYQHLDRLVVTITDSTENGGIPRELDVSLDTVSSRRRLISVSAIYTHDRFGPQWHSLDVSIPTTGRRQPTWSGWAGKDSSDGQITGMRTLAREALPYVKATLRAERGR